MFTSSLNEIEKNNFKIDIITGLDPTNAFLKECKYNIIFHKNLRKSFSALKIFLYILKYAKSYHHTFITAGMTDKKIFLLQFAFVLCRRNSSALTNNTLPIFLIKTLKYNYNFHKTINNQNLIFNYLNIENYSNQLPYHLPNIFKNNESDIDNNNVIIHPGNDAKNSFRRYPIEKYTELINLIIQNDFNKKIYIILGPGELNLEDILKVNLNIHIIDKRVLIIKAPKFKDLITLFSNSNTFITNDSGLAHIAAAFKIKIINIYGPANPSDTSPISTNQIIVQPNIVLDCMPCVKLGGKHGCLAQTCLRSIEPSTLFNLI